MMYRKQYKNAPLHLEANNCKLRNENDSRDFNPKSKRKSFLVEETLQSHSFPFNKAQDIIENASGLPINDDNGNVNLERESEFGESISIQENKPSSSTDRHFQEFLKEKDDNKDLNRVKLDGDLVKSLDPYISIQGDVSFPSGNFFPSHHRPFVKERVVYEHHQHQQQPIIDKPLYKEETKISLETGTKEYPVKVENNDKENESRSTTTTASLLRRTSSLSSIPSYFYPDPYSIVVTRYVDDLGSISSYSATGSERTEYLQLSETVSPLSSPENYFVLDNKKDNRIRRKSKVILSPCTFNETTAFSLENKMNFDSALSTSDEYQSFRSSVPLRKICVESGGSKEWKVYDAGPKTVRTPLLCLGPACSTSDVFFKQILNLTARGVRVISVEGPVYWSVEDWCKSLKKLLDTLNIDKVHIFGASLGGFLAQKFAEYTYQYPRVASLILCNTFLDTSIFDYHDTATIFWLLPSVILKKLIIENITTARIMDLEIAHAIEFMIERLNNLSQQELASRMTLNCVNNHVDTFKLKQIKMTIMDVFDESALSTQARDDLYRNYTDAKLAHLKSGGNFPYLSRCEEVNMHIMVHLRSFNGTKHSAQVEESVSPTRTGIKTNGTNPIPTRTHNGKSSHNGNCEASIHSANGETSFAPSSFQDKNQAYKEKAAATLALPD